MITLDWVNLELEFLLQKKCRFLLFFVPKPAGGAVTPSYWSDSADGCDVCVWTEFTFQQGSVCHETLGATDMAVAFPVVLRCIEFRLRLVTDAPRSVQRDLNRGRNPFSYISALPGIAEIYSEIVLISGIVWCFERPHMVKDCRLFFVP